LYLGIVRRLLLIFVSVSLFNWFNTCPAESQVLDTLYYNDFWQLVRKDSASQFRIAEVDTINLWFIGSFRDYYSDSSLFMEGQYSKSGLKNGPFKIYYSTGQVYCNGFFDNDELSGTWEYYTKNGDLRERVKFSGIDFQVIDSYDKDGNRIVYKGTGKWVKNFVNGDGTVLEATGRYYRQKREGNWKLKNIEGQLVLSESYSNDYFLEGTLYYPTMSIYYESMFTSEIFYPNSLRVIESFTVWDARLADYPYLKWLPADKDSLMTSEVNIEQPDRQAHFPLGREAFYRKVSRILVYPDEAKRRKIEGKVYVEFIVGADGHLYDTHVLKGIGGGCDQQAVIAILTAGKWFPALKNGFPIEQRVVIPVTFRLAP
jgi:TonB family protein